MTAHCVRTTKERPNLQDRDALAVGRHAGALAADVRATPRVPGPSLARSGHTRNETSSRCADTLRGRNSTGCVDHGVVTGRTEESAQVEPEWYAE